MNKLPDFISGLFYCVFATLSIPALVILIIFSTKTGNAIKVVSSTIYGVSLFLLLLFSTLNNWLHLGNKGKRIFRKFNHIFIYIFIAGTYTPICLVGLSGAWGWSIFGVVWFISTLCIVFNSIWVNYPKVLYSCIYIAMGSIILLPFKVLIDKLNYHCIFLLIGDFLFLISGVIYAFNSSKTNVLIRQFFNILILFGITCQYWFIFRYILPI